MACWNVFTIWRQVKLHRQPKRKDNRMKCIDPYASLWEWTWENDDEELKIKRFLGRRTSGHICNWLYWALINHLATLLHNFFFQSLCMTLLSSFVVNPIFSQHILFCISSIFPYPYRFACYVISLGNCQLTAVNGLLFRRGGQNSTINSRCHTSYVSMLFTPFQIRKWIFFLRSCRFTLNELDLHNLWWHPHKERQRPFEMWEFFLKLAFFKYNWSKIFVVQLYSNTIVLLKIYIISTLYLFLPKKLGHSIDPSCTSRIIVKVCSLKLVVAVSFFFISTWASRKVQMEEFAN